MTVLETWLCVGYRLPLYPVVFLLYMHIVFVVVDTASPKTSVITTPRRSKWNSRGSVASVGGSTYKNGLHPLKLTLGRVLGAVLLIVPNMCAHLLPSLRGSGGNSRHPQNTEVFRYFSCVGWL